jgi:hypothetical protein
MLRAKPAEGGMTEREWADCTDSNEMLAYLLQSGRASDRKRRLFTVASYRRVWHLLSDERSRTAVEVSERHADGLASRAEVDAAWEAAEAAGHRGWDPHLPVYAALAGAAERTAQCPLMRDIFGSPFRPVSLNSAWLAWNDGIIRKLAQAIYEERAFDRLPVLGDALEEAGCTDAAILSHCRGPGPHVRGCWVIDLLLGKA